jgi:hypothetical protein
VFIILGRYPVVSIKQVRLAPCLPFGPIVGNQPLDVVWNWTAIRMSVLLWIDKRAKLDQMRNGIEIDSIGFTTESQGFQWNSAATCKRIEYPRHLAIGSRVQEPMSSGDQLAGRFNVFGTVRISRLTRCLMNSKQRLRGVSSINEPSPFCGLNWFLPSKSITSLRNSFGHSASPGSGISDAIITARQVGNGLLAHHKCNAEI